MGAEPTALKTSLTLVGLVAAGVGAGSVIIIGRGPIAKRQAPAAQIEYKSGKSISIICKSLLIVLRLVYVQVWYCC